MGEFSDYCMVPKSHIVDSLQNGRYWGEERKYLIIEVKGTPIGEAVIHRALNYPSSGLEIAICIDEIEHRGKRYGAVVVKMLLKYIFWNCPEINRVQAIMDVDNKPSINLFESCGFTKEGIMRSIAFHGGEFRDSALYSIIRPEWNA